MLTPEREGRRRRTVDGALEFLAANLAVKPATACFLVQLDFDRLFVVAEEARERSRKRVALEEREVVSSKCLWWMPGIINRL